MRRRYFFPVGVGIAAFIGMSAIRVRAECSENAPEDCSEAEEMQPPGYSDDTYGDSAELDGSEEVEESADPDDSGDDRGSNDSDDDGSGF